MSTELEPNVEQLKAVGVEKVDDFLAEAVDYIRHQPRSDLNPPANALSQGEIAFLRRAGAIKPSISSEQLNKVHKKIRESAIEYGQLIASALTQKDVANTLNVGTSRIRQRTAKRELYVLDSPKGHVYPRWQFYEYGLVPGIDAIIPLIRKSVHPIAVKRFFTLPQVDLEDEIEGETVRFTPVDWLLTGHSVEDVKLLAKHL